MRGAEASCTGEWANEQHRTEGMIQNKPCHMSHRLRPQRRRAFGFGTGADDNDISPPLQCCLDDFSLWSSCSLDPFCPTEQVTPPLQESPALMPAPPGPYQSLIQKSRKTSYVLDTAKILAID